MIYIGVKTQLHVLVRMGISTTAARKRMLQLSKLQYHNLSYLFISRVQVCVLLDSRFYIVMMLILECSQSKVYELAVPATLMPKHADNHIDIHIQSPWVCHHTVRSLLFHCST